MKPLILICLFLSFYSCKKETSNIEPSPPPTKDTTDQLPQPAPDTNIIELECYYSPASDTAGNFMYSYFFTNTKLELLGIYMYSQTPDSHDKPVGCPWDAGTSLFKDSVIKRTTDCLTVPLNPALNGKLIFNTEGHTFYGTKNHWVRLWITNGDSSAPSSKILAAYDYYIRKKGYYYWRIK